jgi:protoporphyrinogen IX oxidase
VLALAFGLYLWLVYHISGGWLHAKLVLVLGLIAYHLYCGKLMRDFKAGKNTRSHVWYRWFNEIPVLILFAVVILVVVKPF